MQTPAWGEAEVDGAPEQTSETSPAFDVFARACPSREALEHVTGRWGSLTVGALQMGPCRFNELRRRVDGISEKMLSQTLHALERDGIVNREAQPTNPPRVDYELTPFGVEIAERVAGLIALLEGSMPAVLSARSAYDATREGRWQRGQK